MTREKILEEVSKALDNMDKDASPNSLVFSALQIREDSRGVSTKGPVVLISHDTTHMLAAILHSVINSHGRSAGSGIILSAVSAVLMESPIVIEDKPFSINLDSGDEPPPGPRH